MAVALLPVDTGEIGQCFRVVGPELYCALVRTDGTRNVTSDSIRVSEVGVRACIVGFLGDVFREKDRLVPSIAVARERPAGVAGEDDCENHDKTTRLPGGQPKVCPLQGARRRRLSAARLQRHFACDPPA